ncbi:gliding motility-associated C-terminal domain-containing protein [Winogradskyella sp. HB-48]|uniref:HYR-like domain-containing protein n=1 Tax=Winogradskyella sp. HB-48 TaxID=3416808 RepID=UPI003CEDF9EA
MARYILIVLLVMLPNVFFAQQSPSIQTGVTFQWADTQSNNSDPATIQSITIDGTVYNTFVVPTSYELTRLGPNGHSQNRIRENGAFVGGNSNAANWVTNATAAFQDKNLNHYFTSNSNGRNICSDFSAALTTDAQKQTIFYSPAIPSNDGGVLAVTERGGNNCFYIEVWGTPAGGGPEQKLGETFVRNSGNYTGCNFGVPNAGSDYWQSGRCNDNGQTIGIGLFYLNDIAPTGSQITRIEFIGATNDHGDGKFFLLQKYAVDNYETGCINDKVSGDISLVNNAPSGSTYSLVSGPSPAGIAFNLNTDGTYSYTPTTGFTGSVTFEYEVCLPAPNTSVCDQATVTLNYVDIPPVPTASVTCGTGVNNFIINIDDPIGPEYEYSLNNGPFQSGTSFTGLTEGSYVLSIRNVFTKCEAENTIPITIQDLELTASVTDVGCKLENTGAIDITVSGGKPPYTYSWSNSATSEDISNVFAGTYTVTVTDANGCSISDSYTINQPSESLTSTITSTTDILCHGEATGAIDLTISGGTAPYSVLWDNGSTNEDINGLLAGTYNVTITDANGCTTTNQATINQPSNALTASVSNIVNVDCSVDNTGSFTVSAINGTSPYQYSIDNGTNNQASGLFENLANGSYTVLVTDLNNCTTTVIATIGVSDNEDPQISVPSTINIEGCDTSDITTGNSVFNFNDSGSSDVQSTFDSNPNYNASDDFNISSITYIDVITSTSCPVTVQRTFTITDNCNNTTTTIQTINIVDTTSPTITVPADITIECTDDESSANTGVATGSDTCSTVTVTESDVETAACGDTKTIVRTWTVTDECGNSTSADQIITVQDTTPPILTLPNDITIECGEDESSANTGLAKAEDECGGVTISESDVVINNCGNTKTIIRTWTTSDNCGNSVSADQTITVVDTTPPTFNQALPADVTVECDAVPTAETLTANDNCGNATVDFNETTTAGTCNNEYTLTRTWTASDACGNETVHTQTITVQDTTAPTISVPADITIECTDDESSANTGVATGSDTCGTVTITESDVETAACGNTKTIVRTWTVIDECGNSVSADQTITVVDTTPPTIDNTNTDNIVIQCGVTPDGTLEAWLANNAGATANDTCGTVTWSNDYGANTDVDCANGAITVTFTATDECGNTANTTATYSIIDTVDPVLTIPADATVECTEDTSPASTGTATATDDCAVPNVTFSDVEVAQCGNTKTITRTWTATDACGNSVSADQTITVVDTTPPTISVPADITIECTDDESSANTGVATGADTCGAVTVTESDVETAACGNTKTIVRTWTVTDECGNSVSADQTITVVDTTPPTFNQALPADLTVECDAVPTAETLTANDNCGNATVDFNETTTAGTCNNEYTLTRTWTASDACGNETVHTQTITVQDTTAPTFNEALPADLTVECDAVPTAETLTANDNCGNATVDFNETTTAGTCNNEYTLTRTWTASDACGNETVHTQTITVQDTTAPTISVPADITIECTDDESSANTGVATGSDTCGTVTITESDVETAACGNTKTIVRTWTVIDECGNSVSADQTITVVDTTPPTIDNTNTDNIVIQCGVTPDGTLEAWLANNAGATANDTCGTVTWSNDYGANTDVDCANGAITVTFTATDECGNTANTTATYSIIDTVDPVLTIPADATVECTEDTSPASTGTATATDDCAVPNVTFSDVEVAQCGNTKTITRTWTATDACGNSVSADQTITVVDTTPPTISVPADITIECTDDESSANTGVATGADTCGAVTVTESDVETAACGNTKTIVRTWTVTDECGNSVSADQTITVVDTTPPTFNQALPADLTVECDAVPTAETLTANDNCGDATVDFNETTTAGTCNNEYTLTRTWTASDACGNETVHTQTITVQDTTAPTFNEALPADLTVECDAVPTAETLTANDNCGNATVDFNETTTAGTCNNEYTLTRTWTASDACGNETVHTQTITVQDTTAPTFNEALPADLTVECDAVPTAETLTANDNCGNATVDFNETTTAGTCNNEYTLTRTWTASDACGNETVHTQTITVQDTTAPTFNEALPADLTVECDAVPTAETLTANDNCGNATVDFNETTTAGTCNNEYTLTRTWTASDACGNETVHTQTITVQDTTAPTISVPADITIECTDDESSANTGVATGSDTCGTVTITESDVETAACGNTKTIVRTWTVIDECGNSVSADQTITVVDTTPPTIDNTNTDNIVIQCGVTPDGTLEAWLANNAGATANDTCGTVTWSNDYGANTDVDCANGAITVTFTATDECGNTANTTATYSIIDTVDPVLTIPADATVECTEDTSPASTGTATATDDCAVPNVTFSDVEVAQCGNTKTITRTWTATDACGNSVSADQTITVVDTTPPTISVPADITIECTDDESSANTGVATGADTCGAVTVTESDVETAACGNTKTIVRTWTVTDECGNSVSADQTITVVDTTPPTFNQALPADVTVECDAVPTAETLTANDNCGNATVDFNETTTAGTCNNEYTLTRTWTASDACGNETVHTQTITVQDTTAPTFNEALPADLTVECDAVPTAETLTANDNCGNATVDFNETTTAGTCNNEYTLTRTWTASDACGNETVHTQTITVQDTTAPTISVPADITIECTDDESSANTGVATGSDTCGTVTITESDVETAACGNTKTIVRTWTVIDECGNSVSADQTITVVDTTPPTIDNTNTDNIVIQCGVTPDGTLEAWLANNAGATANDTCGTVTWSNDYGANTDVDCANGAITVTFTATDECGNTANTTATYSIIDTVDPVLTIPADATVECTEDTSPASTGTATATDDCAVPNVTFSDVEVAQCGNTKTITRTWTATDACGNSVSADQTITVVDTTPPTISVPADITIECTDDESSANTGVATGADTCGAVTVTESDVETAACGNTKTIVRTWTVTDECGNSVSADQTITVVDTTPPTFNQALPADLTVECDAVPTAETLTANDNCGDATVDFNETTTAGTCNNEYTLTRTWTASDACGNETVHTQTITVQDTTAPTFNEALPADLTVECDAVPTAETLTANDNCGNATVDFNETTTAGTCNNEYTLTRTWTASDACGNETVHTQTITVQDTTAPTFNEALPADLTVECDAVPTAETLTANDNCGNATVDFNETTTAGTCNNEYTLTRTWTASDACGNETVHTQTITVQDTTAPTFNEALPADLTVECDAVPTAETLTANDNCGNATVDFNETTTAGTCNNEYTLTRTWTASDACGNETVHTQTITVQDTTAPTISVPADITIECTDDESSANTGVATGSDTCGTVTITESDVETAACGNTKTIVRTWTVIDECGNSVSADQTITVVDTTPPTIDNTNTDNIVIQCGVTPDGTLEAWLANNAGATANDTCGTVTWSNDYGANTDVDCANGAITVTFTATDECGNTANTTATYSIIDTVDPVLTIPADATVECTEDTSPASTGTATATDDCAVPNVTFSDVEVAQCGNTKTITRTWTATDACGNSVSADQTITVVDTTPPTISVPADITIECTDDESSANTGVATGADTCGAVTVTESDVETAACGNTKTIVRTWTVTDECGNSVSADQTITVVDTTPPTFNQALPADVTVECDAVPTAETLTANDNCGNATVDFNETTTAGTCNNEYTLTRTWTASDACGNETVHTQTITVQDTTAPTFNEALPADLTVECDAVPTAETLTANDNCGNAMVDFNETTTAGTCNNEYTLTRTWTASDACGNETVHTQTITVQDTTAPTFNETLPADVTVECDAVPTAEALTANDNCGDATVTFEEEITSGACIGDYIIERTWTASDACGNDTTHIQIITVQDTTAPTVVTPIDENITASCDDIPEVPNLVFEDACSNNISVSFNEDSTQTNDFEDYSITRTWTVTDDCGNEAIFTQNIDVEISNVINAFDTNRCVLDSEFDLFELLSGDFDMNGTWSVVSGNATIDGSLFDPSTVDVGMYTFMYSITDGPCPTEVEVNVTIDDDCVVLPCGAEDVVISKTVTANGDSYNEFFTITGVEDCGFVVELQIFNRWGAEIYKNNNYQNDWNGDAHSSSVGSSGKVPTGTYYYIINLRNSGLKPFAGPIYVATDK